MAYLLHNRVSHARLLPKEARHSFTYPTLSFLVSLSELERHELDLGAGWVFRYGAVAWQLTGMRSSAYLYQDERPIREKLVAVLKERGLNPEGRLGEVWLQTMPSYLGWEGINPLSVHYCYEKAVSGTVPQLWVVVLEVHNTFGERHVYVLHVGIREDTPSLGYDHQWTFPRQFHVSPFNDRSGSYICALKTPSHAPGGPISSTNPPLPAISLTQLTPTATKQPKLIAIFKPTRSVPLTTTNVVWSLCNQPLDLLLTFPRIAYEAAKLHYIKDLDVYPKPAPIASKPELEAALGQDRNPVIDLELWKGLGSTIGWNPETWIEKFARYRIEHFLRRRVRSEPMRVRLIPANAAVPVFEACYPDPNLVNWTMDITYRSPQFFVMLLTATDADQAYALGCEGNRDFSVNVRESNDVATRKMCFETCFAPSFSSSMPSPMEELAYLLRSATVPTKRRKSWIKHCLDERDDYLLLLVLAIIQFYALAQKIVFHIFGASFVNGEAPWMAWERLEKHADPVRDPSGSVRRRRT